MEINHNTNTNTNTNNGSLTKLRHLPPSPAPELAAGDYRECLKNHAAALGGHAVDGCGEFTPSPGPSLSCAACGCHRNFHRRRPISGETDSDDNATDQPPRLRRRLSPSSGAPRTLLALGGAAPPEPHRRKARTRFTADQKLRMQELAERLSWRMPKRDADGAVDAACRRIGVERGVFKVWMHNNKQSLGASQAPAPVMDGEVSPATVVQVKGAGGPFGGVGNGERRGGFGVNASHQPSMA